MEVLTESRRPMPEKMIPAGGYTSKMRIRLQITSHLKRLETYLANDSANGCRKRIESSYGRMQPRRQFFTATLKLKTEVFLSECGDECVGRIAGLEAVD
jgi:hypothetical protein